MAPYRNVLLALPLTDVDSGLIEYTALLCRLGAVQHLDIVHVVTEGTAEFGRISSELEAAVATGCNLIACPITCWRGTAQIKSSDLQWSTKPN
jgi:hypothetical protein